MKGDRETLRKRRRWTSRSTSFVFDRIGRTARLQMKRAVALRGLVCADRAIERVRATMRERIDN